MRFLPGTEWQFNLSETETIAESAERGEGWRIGVRRCQLAVSADVLMNGAGGLLMHIARLCACVCVCGAGGLQFAKTPAQCCANNTDAYTQCTRQLRSRRTQAIFKEGSVSARLHMSHIPTADQNFGTNRSRPLCPQSAHKRVTLLPLRDSLSASRR
jgi:hypothetical protein